MALKKHRYPRQCQFCGAPEEQAFGREKTVVVPDEIYAWMVAKSEDGRFARIISREGYGFGKLVMRGQNRDYTIEPESAQ